MTDEPLSEEEAYALLRSEDLTHWSWFETGPVHADEAGIRKDGEGWLVYSTDERAAEAYRRHHADESAALSDFLHRARANTRFFHRRAERVRADAERVRADGPDSA